MGRRVRGAGPPGAACGGQPPGGGRGEREGGGLAPGRQPLAPLCPPHRPLAHPRLHRSPLFRTRATCKCHPVFRSRCWSRKFGCTGNWAPIASSSKRMPPTTLGDPCITKTARRGFGLGSLQSWAHSHRQGAGVPQRAAVQGCLCEAPSPSIVTANPAPLLRWPRSPIPRRSKAANVSNPPIVLQKAQLTLR